MMRFLERMNGLWRDRNGASAIEYAFIAAAIGLMLVLAFPSLSDNLGDLFGRVTTSVSSVS